MYLGFFSGQILRACAYYKIARLSTTWKFNASDQTVGHGLKLTKRTFHQNTTERFLQSAREYEMFT